MIDIGMAVVSDTYIVLNGMVHPVPLKTRFVAVLHRNRGCRLAIVDRAGQPLDRSVIGVGEAVVLGEAALGIARSLEQGYLLVLYHRLLIDRVREIGLLTAEERIREAADLLTESISRSGQDLITFV